MFKSSCNRAPDNFICVTGQSLGRSLDSWPTKVIKIFKVIVMKEFNTFHILINNSGKFEYQFKKKTIRVNIGNFDNYIKHGSINK